MKLYTKNHGNYKSYKITELTIPTTGNQSLNFISTKRWGKIYWSNAVEKHNDLFKDAIEHKRVFAMFHEIIEEILESTEEKTFTYCFTQEQDYTGTLILTETGRFIENKYEGSQTILDKGDNETFNKIDEISKHILLCSHSKDTVICGGILKMSKVDEKYKLVVDYMSGSYKTQRANFDILVSTLSHVSGGEQPITIEPIYSNVICKKEDGYCQSQRKKYCDLMTQSPDYSKICKSGGKRKSKKRRKNKKLIKKRRKTKKSK